LQKADGLSVRLIHQGVHHVRFIYISLNSGRMVFPAGLAASAHGYFDLSETVLSGRGQEEKNQPPLI
jgi:hypothetical protein